MLLVTVSLVETRGDPGPGCQLDRLASLACDAESARGCRRQCDPALAMRMS